MEIQSIYTAMHPSAIHLPRDVLKDFFEIFRPFTENQSISNNKELWLAHIDDKHILYNKIIFQAYNQKLKDYIACYGITERSTLLNIQKYSELLPKSVVNKLDSAPAHTLYLLHAIVIAELLATKRQKDAYLQELPIIYKDNWHVHVQDGITAAWSAFTIYKLDFAPACKFCGHPCFRKKGQRFCQPTCKDDYHNAIKRQQTIQRKLKTVQPKQTEQLLKKRMLDAQAAYNKFMSEQ
tara:strand:+ start:408 stop:1118 length:711 start_codon:yes stop_codon:yes gene_type:complete